MVSAIFFTVALFPARRRSCWMVSAIFYFFHAPVSAG